MAYLVKTSLFYIKNQKITDYEYLLLLLIELH